MTYETKQQELYRKDEIVEKSAACTLTLTENFVHATANTSTGSYAITLPNVNKAKGREFLIWATIADTKAVTVQDQDESRDWTDLVLDTDGDMVHLKSTGEMWVVVENRIA